jgi:hypothetical protein
MTWRLDLLCAVGWWVLMGAVGWAAWGLVASAP